MPVIAYGHAGDGNVHLHPVCVNVSEDEWRKKLPDLMTEIYRASVHFGGTISGEHGIGLEKKPFLRQAMSPEAIELLRGIKKVFDPKGILNPGKIWEVT